MKELMKNPIVVALATAAAMWIGGWVRQFLAKRIRVQGPEAAALKAHGEVLAKLCPAVNLLIELKGPEQTMLIAIGEALQGKNNGNVSDALEGMRGAVQKFESFRDKAACIVPASMEQKSA